MPMPEGEAAQNTPPVVLAHGWGGTYETTWSGGFLEKSLLAEGRTIKRFDLPGHGRRVQPHDAASYTNIADQLLGEFDDESTVDAVGFSLGGKLLLDLAARYPSRFRRLVIAAVGANLFRPENGQMVTKAITATDPLEVPAGLQSLVASVYASGNDVNALSAVICRPTAPLQRQSLASVTVPVLLVVGKEDRIVGDVHELYSALPSATLEVLDGVDHMETASSKVFQELAFRFLSP